MPARGNVNSQNQLGTLRQQVDLLRFDASAQQSTVKTLDAMMKELNTLLLDKDITKFNKARLTELFKAAEATIDDYYSRQSLSAQRALSGVAEAQANATSNMLETTYVGIDLSATLPTDAFLAKIADKTLVFGAPQADWWARQARDTAFRFATTVRQGLAAAETTEQIASRVMGRAGYIGIAGTTKANARSLVHASVMSVASEARFETFKQNDDIIEGIRQISTLDSNTTDICMAYDGAEYDLDGDPINGTTLPYNDGVPRHWGCRSVEVPITKTFKELGIDAPEAKPGTRASEDGPVPAKMTFSDFLDEHTPDEQDEMLGAGRAEMWRNGDITLTQLLDQKGNPLTLSELQDKYG